MRKVHTLIACVGLAAITGFALPAFAHPHTFLLSDWIASHAEGPRVSEEKSGNLSTKDGLALHVDTNLGDIRVFTDGAGQVSYRAVAQMDAREPDAQSVLEEFTVETKRDASGVTLQGRVPDFNGRMWVVYEIHVPRRYDLVIDTKGGDIQVQDVDGRITLTTAGGRIMAGNVNPPSASTAHRDAARIDSDGGDILIGDVSGDLHAVTGGGHIAVGNVSGKAHLRTGGGYIRAGNIQGAATLETGGGSVRVQSVHSGVTASTVGGQIEFGEVTGTIHARTGGGAIRIDRTAGSASVDVTGGNLFLHRVDGAINASSDSGSITAWLSGPDEGTPPNTTAAGPAAASQLSATDGNVVVYLPTGLPATLDATVESGGDRHIVVDPALSLHFEDQPSDSEGRERRYKANFNGGGQVLTLKAAAGNIFLRSADSRSASLALVPGFPDFSIPASNAHFNSASSSEPNDLDAQGFFDEVRRMFETSWWGALPMDSTEMERRLVHSVPPVYPDVAQKAGVEGDVVLRVYISSDGRVTELHTLEGPPILARAAEAAVQQWTFRPVLVNGRPTEVVTTLTIAFRMH